MFTKSSLQWRNTQSQYGIVAKILHWIIALSIFILFGVGLWMVDLDYYHSYYTLAPWIHKSVGILIFYLMIFRLCWRLFSASPTPVSQHKNWEKMLAKMMHRLFYALIFIILVSGYLISTADGRPIEVFNWFTVPAIVTSIDNQEDIAGWVHFITACVLMGFVLLHILGALKHHFIDKDNSLKRILGLTQNKKL
jgi:cytochrome b561